MNKTVGVVQAMRTKEGQSRRGPWKVVNLCIDDDWFGGYTRDAATLEQVTEGAKVAIEWEANGQYKNIKACDIMEAPKPNASGGGSGGNNEYQANKEWHISLGAGINQAVALFPVLVSEQIIKLPSKQADAYDAALEYVKAIATELAEFNYFSERPEAPEDEEEGFVTNEDGGDLSE